LASANSCLRLAFSVSKGILTGFSVTFNLLHYCFSEKSVPTQILLLAGPI
jgi:hypothetical protein